MCYQCGTIWISLYPFVIPPFHPSSCPVPRQLLIHFLSPLFSLHFLEFYKHGIFSNVASFIQHILRFIRLCISYSFLFIAVESCCINMLQFIHWLIHEHLGCFQFATIKNRNTINTSVEDFVWAYAFISLWGMPGSWNIYFNSFFFFGSPPRLVGS